ncbi:TIGR02281 family clan AA aspartic protease [uncultured Sphingomonas sp.]|uniref:retropepsin-like aspartic protease family protein n=1 Tax=uncultured Sphingomonas sp. TaxID=158754 RepID=UPI0035CB3E12
MKIALLCTVVVGVVIGVSLPVSPPAGSPGPVTVAAVAAAEPEDPPVDTVLKRSPGGHFYAVVEVNGEPIRFLVDTGASVVAMTQADAKRAHIIFDQGDFVAVGKGAAGVVRGKEVAIDRIVLDGKTARGLRGIVMADSEMSLLGQNYLRNLDVAIKGDTMTLR